MSKTNAFETSALELIFQNADLNDLGDSTGLRGATTAGSLYVALYTSPPAELGGGTEVSTGEYTNYARIAVARSAGGWTVSGNEAINTAAVTFAASSGGTGCTVSAVGIHYASTGDYLLYYGNLDSSLVVTTGVAPEFEAGDLKIQED